jgi:hypothetical protein
MHAVNQHARNLARDDIRRGAKSDLVMIERRWDKAQQVMVNLAEITTMLPGIIQTFFRYLRESTAPFKSRGRERIQRIPKDVPIRL